MHRSLREQGLEPVNHSRCWSTKDSYILCIMHQETIPMPRDPQCSLYVLTPEPLCQVVDLATPSNERLVGPAEGVSME
jgi:hypothetical protein